MTTRGCKITRVPVRIMQAGHPMQSQNQALDNLCRSFHPYVMLRLVSLSSTFSPPYGGETLVRVGARMEVYVFSAPAGIRPNLTASNKLRYALQVWHRPNPKTDVAATQFGKESLNTTNEVHWPAWLARSEVGCWNTRFVVERGFLSCVDPWSQPLCLAHALRALCTPL